MIKISTPIARRSFMKLAAGAGLSSALSESFAQRALAAGDKPTLVNSIRSLSNPYHAVWNQGGQAFAASVGSDYVTLVTEGNSEKGLADIRAILAKTGGNAVINIDPNDAPDARPILDACVNAKAHLVTQWTKPPDLHPWDRDPYYTAHIDFDGIHYGAITAKALFEAIGGKGGVCVLNGTLSTNGATRRRIGMMQAAEAFPDITILDQQVGDWQSNKAFDITSAWLTRFGSDVKGIWAANDDMALGGLEALRGEGLVGKVLLTGIDGIKSAIEAVKAGEFVATVSWDPFWQGSMGLAIGYAARTGIFDPGKEPHDHREFYGIAQVVTKDNVEQFYKENFGGTRTQDFKDIWGRCGGLISEG